MARFRGQILQIVNAKCKCEMEHTKNLFRAQMSHISQLERNERNSSRREGSIPPTAWADVQEGLRFPHGETKNLEYISPVPR